MKRSRRGSRCRRPARCETGHLIERLEPRHALAVTFAGGVWTIVGDADAARPDDTIVIEQNPANARQLRATINGVVADVRSMARVRSIHVIGGAGDDSITVDVPATASLTTRLEGGFGSDTITGGPHADVILGGPGRDTLNGRGGNDDIRGNGGVDSLVGGVGDDVLHGGAGVDTLRGGVGRNTLDGGLAVDAMFGATGHDVARLDAGERLIANESTNPLVPITDLGRLKSWAIEAMVAQWKPQLGREAWSWWNGGLIDVSVASGGASLTTTTGTTADYSRTNTQVVGVDEGDRVKTDGTRLYAIAGDGIDILDVSSPERLGVLAHLALPGHERQLFLDGSRLTVIADGMDESTVAGDALSASWSIGPWFSQVIVTVVDVADPSAPVILETTTLDGGLIDARAIDDRIVVVTQDSVGLPSPEVIAIPRTGNPGPVPLPTPIPLTTSTAAPVVAGVTLAPARPIWLDLGDRFVYEDEASYRARLDRAWNDGALPGFRVVGADGVETSGSLVEPKRTWLPADGGEATLLSIASFTVGDAVAGPDATTTAAGAGGRIYASASGLYVFDAHHGAWWDRWASDASTNIYKFDLTSADVPLVAMGSVSGTTLDQFSLDESDGFLRVATTDGFGWDSSARVTVLAAAAGFLETVGSVAGLAPGERIYSVRFVGSRGYVSTFRQIDPLFVIDLATPAAPRVTGELKVPGYSTHLMPIGADHLLGIGRDVDPLTGRDLGLQLSLFDVGDPARPKRSATYSFGGDWSSWSPASWDHHALGWFAEQGILALPIQEGGPSTDLVVFRIDVAAADAFVRLGKVSHESSIERSVRIGDVLYAVSSGEVTAHPLTEPAVTLAAADLSGFVSEPIFVV